ncbi:MFS transporter, partial [Klebsiella pneumoniae]|nr:MFS transporter [Klebsiella pneumoniae]
VVWWAVFKETPEAHKGVNAAELAHIQRGLPPPREDEPKVPRTKLLTHRNIWAMCIGFFMINYNSYFFITWLPTYLVKER